MAGKRWRFDPYKNFPFRVVAAAALAGAAAFGITKTLLSGKRRKKKPHVDEVDSGARPIEAVGTSTAGFVGTAPDYSPPKHRSRRRARRTSRS
jgi:hypothetical protein